jgi:VIT1/CCC1 family predicted Fe2+/Mn2+ transporter
MSDFYKTLMRRFAALFLWKHLEQELDAEVRSHLEMAEDINRHRGMSEEEARREALRSFGGVEQAKELYRDQRGLPMIETTLQDLWFG